jgi:hypothetical protein
MLPSARDCRERIYIRDIHAALQGLEASRIVPNMVLGCREEMCALCNRNKVGILRAPALRHSGIQGSETADALAKEWCTNPFLRLKPTVLV